MFAWSVAWMYGALSIASLWAMAMWIMLAVSRPFAEDFKGFRKDTYVWIAGGNVAGCIGTFILSIMRALEMVWRGGSPPHFVDPVAGAAGLLILLTSRVMMIYASSIASKPWRWRWFVFIIGAWTVFLVWWPSP